MRKLRTRILITTAMCVMTSLVAAEDRKPNILIIMADDLGYADLGFQGCEDIPTPHLDALARSGVRFSNGYVSAGWCSPTRAGLLTGRHQERWAHEPPARGVGGGAVDWRPDPSQPPMSLSM